MNKQTIIFIFFLSILAILLGYNYFARPFEIFSERFTSPQIAEDFNVEEELKKLTSQVFDTLQKTNNLFTSKTLEEVEESTMFSNTLNSYIQDALLMGFDEWNEKVTQKNLGQ